MRLFYILALCLFSASAAAAQTSKFGIPSTSGAGAITPPVSTFAQLPTCDISHLGFLRVIVDGANSPTYAANAAGGGTTVTLVMCNSTKWVNQ